MKYCHKYLQRQQQQQEKRKVKTLYNFEASEENEISFTRCFHNNSNKCNFKIFQIQIQTQI